MEAVLTILVVVLLVGILVAVFAGPARPVVFVIVAVVIYVPSCLGWFALRYLQLVPVEAFLAQTFGIESHQLVGTPLGTVMLFGPPLLPSVALLGWFAVTRTRTAEIPS